MKIFTKLLDTIFGRKKEKANNYCEFISSYPALIDKSRERNANIDNNWLTLIDPDFFGRAHFSPDKRWVVSNNDSDGAGRGGYRESGNGRVVLIDVQADKFIHEKTCFARPVDASVADTGSYIVHDAGFGSFLQGEMIALSAEGHERYRRRYKANIFNIGFSKCGRYAAIQTANAPNEDGNILEILDIRDGRKVFTTSPVSGWADKYFFDVDAKGSLREIFVEHNKLGRFRYSASGEFLDTEALVAARLSKGDYGTKILAARDLIETSTESENAKKALKAIDSALSEGAENYPNWAAIAYRVRGEAYEILGQLPEALAAFDRALLLNPKIGVKRRATTLRKKLMTN